MLLALHFILYTFYFELSKIETKKAYTVVWTAIYGFLLSLILITETLTQALFLGGAGSPGIFVHEAYGLGVRIAESTPLEKVIFLSVSTLIFYCALRISRPSAGRFRNYVLVGFSSYLVISILFSLYF